MLEIPVPRSQRPRSHQDDRHSASGNEDFPGWRDRGYCSGVVPGGRPFPGRLECERDFRAASDPLVSLCDERQQSFVPACAAAAHRPTSRVTSQLAQVPIWAGLAPGQRCKRPPAGWVYVELLPKVPGRISSIAAGQFGDVEEVHNHRRGGATKRKCMQSGARPGTGAGPAARLSAGHSARSLAGRDEGLGHFADALNAGNEGFTGLDEALRVAPHAHTRRGAGEDDVSREQRHRPGESVD